MDSGSTERGAYVAPDASFRVVTPANVTGPTEPVVTGTSRV
jgi:hypothetical protein